jgi:hypothetical protein
MDQADSVLSTPLLNSSSIQGGIPPLEALSGGLAEQQAARLESLEALARLRREARDEILKLIQFLDQSDPYAMTELEEDDDREPLGDEEPSLGSFDQVTNQEKSYLTDYCEVDAELDTADDEPSLGSAAEHERDNQERWAEGNRDDREGDEHDGREPEDEGGEAVHENDEPSLGWTDEEAARGRTYAGSMGPNRVDLEEGQPARHPQQRTVMDRPQVSVECSYRRFLRGLTDDQRAAVRSAIRNRRRWRTNEWSGDEVIIG